jgi:hypothetical protein
MFKKFFNKSFILNQNFNFKTENIKRAITFRNPDFFTISRPGVFYVDRTDYIAHLETSGKVLTFLPL